MKLWDWVTRLWRDASSTVDDMSDDPAPDQTLPGDLPPDEVDPDAPVVDNTLPEEQPPRGSGQNRGKDEEARAQAPGQQKKSADE